MAGIEGFLPILVLFAGNLLGIELLLHLVPGPQEAIESEASGHAAAYDGWLPIELGDGVAHEFVVLQESVEEFHLGAELGYGQVLRPDLEGFGDAVADLWLDLPGTQLIAAIRSFADARGVGHLLLGEAPLVPEPLYRARESRTLVTKQFLKHVFVLS